MSRLHWIRPANWRPTAWLLLGGVGLLAVLVWMVNLDSPGRCLAEMQPGPKWWQAVSLVLPGSRSGESDSGRRQRALDRLSRMGPPAPEIVSGLWERARAMDEISPDAAMVLASYENRAMPVLFEVMHGGDVDAKLVALDVMNLMRNSLAHDTLLAATHDPSPKVQLRATGYLVNRHERLSPELLRGLSLGLENTNPFIRLSVAMALTLHPEYAGRATPILCTDAYVALNAVHITRVTDFMMTNHLEDCCHSLRSRWRSAGLPMRAFFSSMAMFSRDTNAAGALREDVVRVLQTQPRTPQMYVLERLAGLTNVTAVVDSNLVSRLRDGLEPDVARRLDSLIQPQPELPAPRGRRFRRGNP